MTTMSEHRFHLQKYRHGSKIACPYCGRPKCFTRYVDEQGEITFPENVGRCDHEGRCGTNYTPSMYFQDNPGAKEHQSKDYPLYTRSIPLIKTERPKPVSFIDDSVVTKSLKHYEINPLYQYLCGIFGEKETANLFSLYSIGTSTKWGGSTVFWQKDMNGKFRTGKIMKYDKDNGHRIKEPVAYVGWAHSEMKLENFHLMQCLFGEHLLPVYPDIPVMIVESEKTAIICRHFMPDYLWLATGGKNGCFNADTMQVLKGRDVILFPDLGAYSQWCEKVPMLKNICHTVSVSDYIEGIATDLQREAGWDIADFLLMTPTNRVVLNRMIQRNPALQLLIDKLELELLNSDEPADLSVK